MVTTFSMMESMLGSSFVLSLGGLGGSLGRWLVLFLLMRIALILSGFIMMIGSFFLGALFTSSGLCCLGCVLRMMLLKAKGAWPSSSSSLQSLVVFRNVHSELCGLPERVVFCCLNTNRALKGLNSLVWALLVVELLSFVE